MDTGYTKEASCVVIRYTLKLSMRDAAINLRAKSEQRDLIDQVFFNLDTDQYQQFISLLDAPVSPNAGLQRLMAVQAPWAISAE